MKIALFTDGISPYVTGGMEKHSHYLAKNLVLKGFTVDLYHCIYDFNQKLPSKKEVDLIFFKNDYFFNEVYSFYFPKSFYFPGHYLYNSYKYSNLLYKKVIDNKLSYDFIYSKGFTSWKFLIMKSNFKIATNFHGYEMFQKSPNFKYTLKKYLFRYLVKWINNRSNFIISYGGKITNIIQSLNIKNIKVEEIPTAIDKSWILNELIRTKKTTSRKVLFIGRNEDRKGFKELIKAINRLNNKILLEFHFIGPDLMINSSINGLSVKFHGLIKDDYLKKKIIDQCDILICPSYSEGMPNVILEAMSRGLAIIASNVGASSLLVDENNGVLIDEISVSAIYNSLIIINNMSEHELNIKKLSSLKKIKNYSWEKVIEKVCKMIIHSKNS